MRILVVSQYFWPESFIINDIVKKLAQHGHHVTVATGKPNYPDGVIFDGYQREGVSRETYAPGVTVVRIPLRPRGKGGAKNLALNYLSFVWSGLVRLPWLLRGQEFDTVLVFGLSPILQAIPAILLKWLKRAPLTIWVQDLWPESLEATGFVRNKGILAGVGLTVRAIYTFSDQLLVQSHAFFAPISRYANINKLVYHPNSVNLDLPDEPVKLPEDLARLLDTHFCVVFAGNLGAAQALDTVVEAAKLLRDHQDLKIVLIGSGSMQKWVADQATAHGLDNLHLAGRYPSHFMPSIFEKAQALLVSLTDNEAFAQTVPSKIQAYLAAARPIVASVRGEAARVLGESRAGLSCTPQDAPAMADAILRVKAMTPEERLAMGTAGRAYFDANFEMNTQVERLIDLLDPGCIAKKRNA